MCEMLSCKTHLFTVLIGLLVVGVCANTQIIAREQPKTSSIWQSLLNFREWFSSPASSERRESVDVVTDSRTFGKIRRLQMALIPLLFKFGVMSALIGVLVFLGLKTVFLLKALLVLNAAVLLVKLIHSKYEQTPAQHQPLMVAYGGGWGPHQQGWGNYGGGWQKSADINKEVHVHIHNDGHSLKSSGSGPSGDYYSQTAWNRNDVTATDPYRSHHQAEEELMNSRRPVYSQHYRNIDPGQYIRQRSDRL